MSGRIEARVRPRGRGRDNIVLLPSPTESAYPQLGPRALMNGSRLARILGVLSPYGATMARRRMQRLRPRSIGTNKHVRLHRWMLDSVAWRHASLAERCLLVELYDLYNGDNNGRLFLSVRDAARRLKIGKNTAQRGLIGLQAKGFIRPRQRGSFDWKSRQATSWILTEFPCDGQPPTKDFMRWSPMAEIQNTVPTEGTLGPHARDRDSATVSPEGTGVPLQGPSA